MELLSFVIGILVGIALSGLVPAIPTALADIFYKRNELKQKQ